MASSEKAPLLGAKETTPAFYSKHIEPTTTEVIAPDIPPPPRRRRRQSTHVEIEEIVLKRHITLGNAIAIIVGGVAGSGIFIAPTGVTKNIGSVGASLVMWTFCGLSNIVLALCYAELGTALPVAGGDYAYLQQILGPLPAFLCLWINILVLGPGAGAVMARTFALHILETMGLPCNTTILILLAIIITALNVFNVAWSARVMTVFSLAKLLALAIIIVTGVVYMAQGQLDNFQEPFEGTNLDVGSIVASYLPGFIAYVGWDCVNTLVEELENPGRNLPLSVTLSMALVTVLYVLTNMAYFTILSLPEFLQSDAVAMIFAAKALSAVSWAVPIAVALAAAGSVNGLFLVFPRAAYAGAKDGQLPDIFSYVSIHYVTPFPAILLLCGFAVFYVSATFLDIQGLLTMLGVVYVIKIILVLIALLKLKFRHAHLKRTVKVHPVLVILCLVFLLAVVGIAITHDPFVNGLGATLFVLGVPIYYAGNLCARSEGVNSAMDKLTEVLQRLLLVVPTS